MKMVDTVLTTPLLRQSRCRAKSSSSSSFSGINSSSHCFCRSYNLIRRELRDDIFFSFHVVFRSPLCRYASSQSAQSCSQFRDAILNDITYTYCVIEVSFDVVEHFVWKVVSVSTSLNLRPRLFFIIILVIKRISTAPICSTRRERRALYGNTHTLTHTHTVAVSSLVPHSQSCFRTVRGDSMLSRHGEEPAIVRHAT